MEQTPSKSKTPSNPENKYKVTSLDKALLVLELLIDQGRDLSITEICQKLHMVKGTVHRVLSTLVARNSSGRTAKRKCTALACGRWKSE